MSLIIYVYENAFLIVQLQSMNTHTTYIHTNYVYFLVDHLAGNLNKVQVERGVLAYLQSLLG